MCFLTYQMTDYDRYREQAKFAQEQADRAANPMDKAAWLQIASGWLSLLPRDAAAPNDRFDEVVRLKGTHQDVSDADQ